MFYGDSDGLSIPSHLSADKPGGDASEQSAVVSTWKERCDFADPQGMLTTPPYSGTEKYDPEQSRNIAYGKTNSDGI